MEKKVVTVNPNVKIEQKLWLKIKAHISLRNEKTYKWMYRAIIAMYENEVEQDKQTARDEHETNAI